MNKISLKGKQKKIKDEIRYRNPLSSAAMSQASKNKHKISKPVGQGSQAAVRTKKTSQYALKNTPAKKNFKNQYQEKTI